MAEEPSYTKKKYIEYTNEGLFNALNDGAQNKALTINQAFNLGSIGGIRNDARQAAEQIRNMGLGDYSIQDFLNRKNDIGFLEQTGLGKGYSTADYVKRYAASDPSFDATNPQIVNDIAKEIESRGLNPQTQKEDIQSFITQRSVQGNIDKAVNPGKYLDETQKTNNLSTANRLISQIYGEGANDPDLAQFLSERLAEGESAFEISQFLKTTPDYMKKQSEIENARVQEESTAARQALDQQLQQSQQEVFGRAAPNIIASYMRAGRLGSSGLNSALAQAQADLERERQGFLGNAGYQDAIRSQGYRREDFVNNNAQAFNQYLRQSEPGYQQRFNVQNAGNYANFQAPYDRLNRQYALNDQARQRQYELEDYQMQQSDFNRYLSDQKKSARQNLPYSLLGQLGAAGLQGWMMRR